MGEAVADVVLRASVGGEDAGGGAGCLGVEVGVAAAGGAERVGVAGGDAGAGSAKTACPASKAAQIANPDGASSRDRECSNPHNPESSASTRLRPTVSLAGIVPAGGQGVKASSSPVPLV